jgi:hypothetical protein
MLNLFNPWVWIGVLFVILGAATAGYSKGENDELMRQQAEIAALNAEARQKEQALIAAVNVQSNQLQKANQNAKLLQQKHNADIESGMLKLRIAVKASDCPVPTSADASVTSGADLRTTTAELDSETSKALIALTSEGDTAIRKLATCVALYNEARETLKGQK